MPTEIPIHFLVCVCVCVCDICCVAHRKTFLKKLTQKLYSIFQIYSARVHRMHRWASNGFRPKHYRWTFARSVVPSQSSSLICDSQTKWHVSIFVLLFFHVIHICFLRRPALLVIYHAFVFFSFGYVYLVSFIKRRMSKLYDGSWVCFSITIWIQFHSFFKYESDNIFYFHRLWSLLFHIFASSLFDCNYLYLNVIWLSIFLCEHLATIFDYVRTSRDKDEAKLESNWKRSYVYILLKWFHGESFVMETHKSIRSTLIYYMK